MITLKDCLNKYNDYVESLSNQYNYFEIIDKYCIIPVKYNKIIKEDLIYLLCYLNIANDIYYDKMKYIIYYDNLPKDFKYYFNHKVLHLDENNNNNNNMTRFSFPKVNNRSPFQMKRAIFPNPSYNNQNNNYKGYNINYFIKHNIFPTNENYDRDILYRIINLDELFKLYEFEFINETYKNKLMLYQHKYIINIIMNNNYTYTYTYNLYNFIKRFIEEIVDNCNETNKKLAIDHLVKVIYSYISILLEYDIHLLLHNYLCNEYCYVKENFKCIKIILQLLILYYYSKLPKYYLENNIEYINCFYKLFINCNEFITYRTDEQNIEYMKELNINLDDCINKFMYKYNKINNQKQNYNTKIDKQIKYNDIETNTENNNIKQDCVIKVETLNITINN